MSDINKAWERNTGIQINYIDESLEKDKECICIYDNKKVLSVDIKRRPEIEELIRTSVQAMPCSNLEVKG